MHEYSLVHALLERVEVEARSRGAIAVRRVGVRIGALSGVDRQLFATAYDLCRPGTACAAAELTIAGDAVSWRCDACGAVIPEGSVLTCPTCHLPARLTGGDALTLEHLELEVPHHV
jgi:hydrogenase nickel incorporation protein HypA/HybF